MKTENLTQNDVPFAIAWLCNEVLNLKQLLTAKKQEPDTNQWFNLTELCNYLPDRPAKATIYGMVSKGLIPNHKTGKKLRFLKSEIDNFLLAGKQKTVSEIADEVDNHLIKTRRAK
ncbi:MAG: hypothetical protein A2046_12330 [Bacteroidetes bacterium GWA2_30_7]|nr:MAG: hypothetical protein A2046_12330 [Bacteroidetes bacterium GWA2_30_7]